MCFMQWRSGGSVHVKTYFEIDHQIGGGLVPGGDEVQPQLLNGAHGRSGREGDHRDGEPPSQCSIIIVYNSITALRWAQHASYTMLIIILACLIQLESSLLELVFLPQM